MLGLGGVVAAIAVAPAVTAGLGEREAVEDAPATAQSATEAVSPESPAAQEAAKPVAAPEAPQAPADAAVAESGMPEVLSDTAIAGRVENEAGEPVEGAQVTTADWDLNDGNRGVTRRARTVSNRAGEFALNNLAKAEPGYKGYRLAVKADGYAAYVSEYLMPGTRGAEFVLSRGAAVAGQLVYSDSGAPVANMEVRISQEDGEERLSAQSDAEGWFFFANAAAGRYHAGIVDDELVVVPETAIFDVDENGGPEDLVIRVATGGVVKGRVYDADSGEGIAGIEILALTGGLTSVSTFNARTGSDGRYEFKGLAAGRYAIQRRFAQGYGLPGGMGDTRDVMVRLGKASADVDFALNQRLRISGHVVDESGAPLAGIVVYGTSASSHSLEDQTADTAKTRDDGSFVVGGFSTGADVSLFLDNRWTLFNADPAGGRVRLEDHDVTGVRLVVGPGATISGTVVTAQGDPKAGVSMYAQRVSPADGRKFSNESSFNGSITFQGLNPGTYRLMFADVPGWRADEAQTVTVPKGGRVTGLKIIYPENRGLSISGRVTDAHGSALSGATVSVFGSREVRTDISGQYQVDSLESREYTMTVRIEGYSTVNRRRVSAGSTGVNFALKQYASVEGRVVSRRTGDPVTEFDLAREVVSPDGNRRSWRFRRVLDPEGRFRFQADEGDVTVKVRAEGYAPARVPIGPVAGGTAKGDVIVRLTTGAVLTGRVRSRSGAAVGGAEFTLVQTAAREPLGLSNPDGSYRLTSVPAGSTILHITPPGYAPTEIAVNLSPSTETQRDVVVNDGGAIEGVVTLDGNPFAGFLVSVTTTLNDVVETRIDSEGYYRIPNLPAGAAKVKVLGRSDKPVTIEVVDGETYEVNFDL